MVTSGRIGKQILQNFNVTSARRRKSKSAGNDQWRRSCRLEHYRQEFAQRRWWTQISIFELFGEGNCILHHKDVLGRTNYFGKIFSLLSYIFSIQIQKIFSKFNHAWKIPSNQSLGKFTCNLDFYNSVLAKFHVYL